MPVYELPKRPGEPDNGARPPGPPDDMDARVSKLEAIASKTTEHLASIDRELAVIKAQMDSFAKHYATKADLSEAKNSIIMWVVSAILLAQILPALLKKFGL